MNSSDSTSAAASALLENSVSGLQSSRKAVRSWMMYDWANSAFATTILAAVFPVYFSAVLGSTLSSPAAATQRYSLILSGSVLIIALLSPVLGIWADARGSRKRFLLGFAFGGALVTMGMFGLSSGSWVMGGLLFAFARIGFSGSIVFYDALLPHVVEPDEADSVSTKGYALGYLGGGLLLMANVAMIFMLPDNDLGIRLSLASVGVWWLVFTIPLWKWVPEPPASVDASKALGDSPGLLASVPALVASLKDTFKKLRALPDLGRFLIAFLIYNDAISAVIAVAAIYGAELRFGTIELTLAVLLVQFVGVPYSLIFGGLASAPLKRRCRYLSFVLLNIVLLPLVAIGFRMAGPADISGVADGDFGDKDPVAVQAVVLAGEPVSYSWYGQSIEVLHSAGPQVGAVSYLVDGRAPSVDDEGVAENFLATDTAVVRSGEKTIIEVEDTAEHTVVFSGDSVGSSHVEIEAVKVLPPSRSASLLAIIGVILAVQLFAGLVALSPLAKLAGPLAMRLDTKAAITIALVAYTIIALWGFALDSVVEFWGLAWMVAICQGGSQALSRSLFSSLIPADSSGEFFGFFSVISKFASVLSPLVFAASVALFATSRPAIGALSLFFLVGMWLLRKVDVDRGQQAAIEHAGLAV